MEKNIKEKEAKDLFKSMYAKGNKDKMNQVEELQEKYSMAKGGRTN